MNRLTVGLDLVNLRSLVDGVGRFSSQLIEGYGKYAKEYEFIAFIDERIARSIRTIPENIRLVNCDMQQRKYIPRNQLFFLSKYFRLPRLDILHSPISVAPFIGYRRAKCIVTIHDLAFRSHPESTGRTQRIWQEAAWPICFRRVDHIIASSHATKADIMNYYGIPSKRISVIHLCINIPIQKRSREKERFLQKKYGLPEHFILNVGAPHKRKNISNLLRAFKILKKSTSLPHKLLLIGPSGWSLPQLIGEVKSLDLEDEVILIGYVPDNEMFRIYSCADVFVFPSFLEGFGYPPLEAMACGTPVVASGTSSIPEVVGDAALMVNPHSPDDIAKKIIRALSSRELSIKLIRKGRDRLILFSMEKMISSYLEIYESVASDL